MDIIQAIWLAILQGLTEFLPISSSGHLILVPKVLGWPDQGLPFDVAVHLGTLLAVVWYFRKDVMALFVAWSKSLAGTHNTDSKLAWGVLLGTIPAGLVALLFKDLIEVNLRSPLVIAATTIVFGLLLWWADVKGKRARELDTLTWTDVALIGGAQALALIPGTSRSGITMTAALMNGLSRQASARFSFLLSIPVISLASMKLGYELFQDTLTVDWTALAVGVLVSAVSAYLCIKFFLKLLDKIGMAPFALYRLFLGVVLLYLFWGS